METAAAPTTVTPPASADDLARLLSTLAEIERLHAEALALAGRLAPSGVAEVTAGLPLDLLLACDPGLTGPDRHMLITAGQVLETMPNLAAAQRAGRVTWSQVRAVVCMVRRRSLADRAVIDGRIALALETGTDRWDPDALVAAVEAAVDELLARRALEQREERRVEANRLWAQLGFDGRVHGGFAYDPASAATVLNAIAARQGSPAADDPERPPEVPTPQQRSAAEALVDVCDRYLAGAAGGPARPRYVVDVDVSEVDANLPGRLRLRLRGARPRLTARHIAADAAGGADVRVVVSDGAAPLAVSRPVRTDARGLDREGPAARLSQRPIPRAARPGMAALVAAIDRALNEPPVAAAVAGERRPLADPALLLAEDIPAATRVAVEARDGGCRFYGCTAPIDWSDVHHIEERANGGRHHPDRLVSFCRPDHGTVHAHGWRLHLDPATGVLTGRRGGRAWQTLPRGTPLPRGPDPPAPGPPAPDPPTTGDLPF